MKIYVDVLVAINYFVSYLMLQACGRISGLPLGRHSSVVGALVGAFSSLTVFLPLQGFGWGLLCRAVTGLAMLLAAWPGRSRADYLRLLLILLSVSFLFAGAVAAWCFLFPKSPVYLIGPTFIFIFLPRYCYSRSRRPTCCWALPSVCAAAEEAKASSVGPK